MDINDLDLRETDAYNAEAHEASQAEAEYVAPRKPFRFGVAAILQATLITGLALSALMRYWDVMLRINGLVGGGLMLTIGCVVGGVCSVNRGPRWAVILISFGFYVGLINGLIKTFGDSSVNWAYLCGSTGLLIGALYRTGQQWESDDEANVEVGDEIQEGGVEEPLRNGLINT